MRKGHGSTKVPNVKLRPAKKKANQTQNYDDDEPSYEPLRESLRNDASAKPFAGMSICCSGVKDKQALLAKARELGATCSNDFTDLTTHLCVSEHLLPPLRGVVICVTQLDDDNARDRLNKSSRRLGASYRSHMNKEVTHLLIGPDGSGEVDNQKIQWVKRMNTKRREEESEEPQIAVVWDVWLLRCAAAHARVPEEEFAYSETGERPEPPADIEQILRRSSSKKPKKVYVTASNVGATTTTNNTTKEVLEKARVRKVAPKDAVWGSILSSRNQAEETSAPEVTFSSPKPQLLDDDSATEDEEENAKGNHVPSRPVEQPRNPSNRGGQSRVGGSMVSRLNSLRGSAFQLGAGISDHPVPASGRSTSVSNLAQKLGGARAEELPPPPSSTAKVFSGKRIAPIGEACGPMLYDALRAHGASVIEASDPKGKQKAGDSETTLPPEADFYIVRLASESAKQASKLDSYHKFHLANAREKMEQAESRTDGTTTDGPTRLGVTDPPALGNNTSLFGRSNGLLPTQRKPPPLRSSGSGSTEIEGANSLLGYKQQDSAISNSEVRPEQSGKAAQNSQIDRERKREAQRNQLANSLDALLKKHQRDESTHIDQPRKRIRPTMRHKPTDGTPGTGTARAHSLTEQVSSMSLSTHDPDYVSPLDAMQPANEETLQVHYQDPNQLAAKENLRRLLDGSSQVDGDIINVDTQTDPEESQERVLAPVEPRRKRGGAGGQRRRSQRKL
ncbi:hypothetical protein FRC11_003290 [Ceratobasidium sp. 423]|nr:hypothetical protein FRC11_003290 [Ceratobasidium sp. 423]